MKCDGNTLWVIRGMVGKKDASIVVESPTKAEAEAIGWRRGIEVIITSEASMEDVRIAKLNGLLYRYTQPPRLRVFGRAVGQAQAACLALCGIATILLDLRAWHVPLHFWMKIH
jgi:hypothetical protein